MDLTPDQTAALFAGAGGLITAATGAVVNLLVNLRRAPKRKRELADTLNASLGPAIRNVISEEVTRAVTAAIAPQAAQIESLAVEQRAQGERLSSVERQVRKVWASLPKRAKRAKGR